MKNNTPSKKILIILGLIILALFAAFYFVFIDIKHKNEHVSKLSQSLSSSVNKQESYAELRRIIASADADIRRVNSSTIASGGDVAFIENLETIAKENNVTIDIHSLVFLNASGVASTSLTMFKIGAEIEGNWTGVYKFLAEIESLPIKIKINTFGIVSTDPGEPADPKKKPSGNWQSTFEIVALKSKY